MAVTAQKTADARPTPPIDTDLIDCDVHPIFPPNADMLMEWIPGAWKQILAGRAFATVGGFFGGLQAPQAHFLRPESTPPGGGPPGSDPEFTRGDLLDRWGIARAILTPFPARISAWMDPDEAAVVCTAVNRYFESVWLASDDRYAYNMLVAPHDPEQAAAEIRSFGASDGVVGVYLTLRNILMGDRHYYPIYEAAQEMSLPIVFHGNGADGLYQGAPTYAGGIPNTYTERYILVPQQVESHVVNLVFSGVFERFPELKVAFLEAGWAYMPHLLWRMDGAWMALRSDRPWVKKSPSEYVRDHIRFSTQPSYHAPDLKMVDELLKMIYPERTMLFSSDYPHWDGDDPGVTSHRLSGLSDELRQRIFSGNARETFSRL